MDARHSLDVVVPAYNEGEGLREFQARLAAVLDQEDGLRCRVIYVDDGSRDDTWAVIESLIGADSPSANDCSLTMIGLALPTFLIRNPESVRVRSA